MNTTIEALKNLYVAFGGELSDTYADIADGATVGNYVLTPDVINAIAKKVPTAKTTDEPAAEG